VVIYCEIIHRTMKMLIMNFTPPYYFMRSRYFFFEKFIQHLLTFRLSRPHTIKSANLKIHPKFMKITSTGSGKEVNFFFINLWVWKITFESKDSSEIQIFNLTFSPLISFVSSAQFSNHFSFIFTSITSKITSINFIL
jgi:hypothetical protein